MGLRFRKTISILPGVRLNLGKSSASVSVGVPGFRKTFNTKGQVTTTVGLPGTGLYYVDTKNPRKEKEKKKAAAKPAAEKPASKPVVPAAPERTAPRPLSSVGRYSAQPVQVTKEKLLTIHKTADDTIDWQEVLASPEPPDESYNPAMWEYFHGVAAAVLDGDIDTWLRVIYEVNPLDDLLDYGDEFTFGADGPDCLEVEFVVNEAALFSAKSSMRRAEYNDVLQDFVCSTAIRVARDIFALLPVEKTIVHAELRGATILSAAFDRTTMSKIRFGFIDPSDTLSRFECSMNFTPETGFGPVERLQ